MEEELDKIRGVQQFIIPTKELKFFQELKYQLGELGFQVNDRRIVDNASIDCKTSDAEDTFKFGLIAQVPYFIFITSMWGETDTMKQYRLGKTIKPHKSDLPKNITTLLYQNHVIKFLEADGKLSNKQREEIYNRVMKRVALDNKIR